VRADIEGHVWRALESAPGFVPRIRAGHREAKWYGTAGVPGYFRKPHGRGWALVGDASYNRDPITAQGISDAFIEAEMLATVLGAAWSGVSTREDRWAAHETARNERVRPMYEFTTQLAALEPPPPPMRALFAALRGNQDAINAFLSAITGAIPLPDFMSADNLGRIMAAAKDGALHG
jgi:2-polyprenyl-6-methoxyphenol hydroxylase-like FAD-dependent oxidoreductase